MKLCSALSQLWYYEDNPSEEAIDAEEALIKAVIADGNYQHFHITLAMMYEERAKIAMRNGDWDKAVKGLSEAMKHAVEFDRMVRSGIEQYTCPVLSGYTEDHSDDRKEDWSMEVAVRDCSKEAVFDPIREREDFKAVFA